MSGPLLVLIGVIACVGAWAVFRREEHKFFTMVPFNEAHRYMRQPGGLIWWVGIVVLLLGIFESWAAR
jgi:hypothetical protein